jgi:hypothetical protein
VVVGIETDRGCWSGHWLRLATRWWRSTRWRPAGIGSATPSREANPIEEMPECWPIWSALPATITGRRRATRGWPRRSRCWLWPTGSPGPR